MKILFVTAMYPHPEAPGYGSFVKQQAQKLIELGLFVDVYNFQRGKRSIINYLKAALCVFCKTYNHKYDIVHAHYGLSALPALFQFKTPIVLTIHGSDALVGTLQPFLTRLAAKAVREIIVVADHIAEEIPGHVIPCGVDRNVFQPHDKRTCRLKLNLDFDKKYILFPFNPKRQVKRYDLANQAVNRLNLRRKDVELLVIFDVDQNTMPFYYSAADLMILCSDSEGSPTSVKEALACNLPVVTTDVGDIRANFDGSPGILICDSDVDSLAYGLKKGLEGQLGSPMDSPSTISNFDSTATAKAIVQVYRKAIQRH